MDFRERNASRRTLEKKCDRLWSRYIRIRDRGTCQRCGLPGNQPHHIFSRRNKSTRHDPGNGVLLCFVCHRTLAHEDPETFREFLVKRLGEEEYRKLRVRSYAAVRPDHRMTIIALTAEIDRLSG